ncbi:MAG: resolvase [Flavobacteriales bacterium]|nr:resolvase [Flavobacteriales bacterium]
MKAAKYIVSDPEKSIKSKQTIKHTSEGIRYLEAIDLYNPDITFSQREFGSYLIKLANLNEIDTLFVNSIGDLGLTGIDILETIENFSKLGVNIKAKKENIETLNEDGSKNKLVNLIVSFMKSIYEQESKRKKLKQIKGINLAKLRGIYRSNGGNKPKLTYEQFINKDKNQKCLKELKNGESIRRAAKLAGISLGTCVKIKKLAEINGDLNYHINPGPQTSE